jgi:DNA polymerase-1
VMILTKFPDIERANIDGDIVAYRAAASCEKREKGNLVALDPEPIALLRADRTMRDILEETRAPKYELYLSGDTNFRKQVNPEYKANRKEEKPVHLNAVKDFLVREWNASTTQGYEADDALGFNQTANTVICTIDKDLLMVEGNHYNFVKKEWQTVTALEGLQHFYRQALIGDTVDNIFGIRGLGPAKSAKIINHLDNEKDMYNAVCKLYNDPDRLDMNLNCLWIWRNEWELWEDRFEY